jgi:pyruvate dehydrogenase E2 component (dihydrolipoamide acetyltransferase)
MPAVRRLARDLGVDLEKVTGTGARGRILERDVREAAGGAPAPAAEAPAARQPEVPTPAADLPGESPPKAAPPRVAATGRTRVDERVPFRGMRRKIAEKMAESKRRAAHFTYVDEVDCTRLVELRARAKPRAEARGVRLTYLAFLAKAVAKSLEEHPTLNAALDEEAGELILKGECNIGMAVDTDRGLMVPVVRGVHDLSIFEIAVEVERLAREAREGRSRLEDLQGSTFTITSVGGFGGMFATPIINFPEVAILGVNRIEERPVVQDGQVVVRHMTYFAISLDHRVVDGADGARFMNTFKEYVEEPSLLFLDALE